MLRDYDKAINERIKELDIQDCKVRVSNVDSQESFKNIVVQVIGEMSNKAAPHRKFVQTFVLAEQPNGYFVLNDIFRYINEDEEEELDSEEPTENESSAQPAAEAESTIITESGDASKHQVDAAQVDKKLEEEILNEKSESDNDATDPDVLIGEVTNENLEVIEAEDAPVAAVSAVEEADEETEVSQDASEAAVAVITELQPEKPKDPDPTPVASPPAPVKVTPAQAPSPAAAPKPAAPKTWANLVAANRVTQPAIPNQANSASSAPSIPTATRPAANRSVTPPVSSGDDTPGRPQQNGNSGWQTAGPENGKRQGRQQSISGGIDKDNVLGYVKNVTERVDASLLRNALLQYGKLVYFDVSRQKVSFPSPVVMVEASHQLHRIVRSSNSPMLQDTTTLLQRTLTTSGVSRSLSRSVGLGPMPTVVVIVVEGLFVVVAEVLILVQEVKVEATILRTVAEVASHLVEEEEA